MALLGKRYLIVVPHNKFLNSKINKEITMNLTLAFGPLISLLAGILILVMPKLLNYIIALYLIIIGLVGLFGGGNFHMR